MKASFLYLRLLAVSVLVIGLAACGGGSSRVTSVSLTATATGLTSGEVVLKYGNATITLTPTITTAVFATRVNVGFPYTVVVTSPEKLSCTINGNVGVAGTAGTTDITLAVACAPNNSLGGTVSGLAANTSVVLANGSNKVSVAAPDPFNTDPVTFTFDKRVAETFSYGVTVLTDPAGLHCNVVNGVGIMGTTDVTNVQVTCH